MKVKINEMLGKKPSWCNLGIDLTKATKETWKVVETTFCLAKWINQVSSLPVEPLGNSTGLPVGARFKTRAKTSQE